MPETTVIDSAAELRSVCGNVTEYTEGGRRYLHLPRVVLPGGCVPAAAEGLLCMNERDGYETRLFLSAQVNRGQNWTVHRILERNWHTWSWKGVLANQRPSQVLAGHLGGLR